MRKRVQKAYRKWAGSYDKEVNASICLEEAKVIRLMNVRKGDNILDLGCGTGRYAGIFAQKGAKVIGVDFSRTMLKIARKKVKDAEFKQADITKKLLFKDNFFDKIICSLVISHIKNILPILKEMRRLLKDDGFIILTTLHPDTDFWGFEHPSPCFLLSRYDCTLFHKFPALNKLFKKAGLKLVKQIELMIDGSVRHCFTERSYKAIKGNPLGVIFKLEKIRRS